MERKIQYGIVVALLLSSFLISFGIRMQPTNYSWQLDEFDPYFNYRATQYMIDNGYDKYLTWNDDRSWYPNGRDVSETSQVALHWTTATLYQIFGGSTDLYHFAIVLPAILGSLTVFIFFALGRVLVNTQVGVMCAIFFGMSIPFIQRGFAGWLKSEPLGIFFGLLALYLFVSAVRGINKNKSVSAVKILGAGLFMALGLSAWGGVLFFLMPLAVWMMVLPLVMKSNKLKHMIWLLPLYTITLVGVSLLFARPTGLIFSVVGIGIVGPLVVIGIYQVIGKIKGHWKKKHKYLLTLGIVTLIIVAVLGGGQVDAPYGSFTNSRYINALNPLATGSDVLSQSVAEHQIPSLAHIFERTVFVFIFTPIGVIAIIRGYIPKESLPLVLSFGIIGMYVGMSYVRLELFLAGGMILFAAIGIMWLMEVFTNKNKDKKRTGIIIILLLAMIVPAGINWSIMVDRAPLIMTGAGYIADSKSTDWLVTLEWLKNNTEDDAVVLAWWDYGYWLSTMGEKITIMDNAANNSIRITQMSSLMTADPIDAYAELKEEGIDYVLFFTIGHKINDHYILGYGGDLSKMGWIMRIGERDPMDFKDGITQSPQYNDKFWHDTIAGRMIPFEPVELNTYDKAMMEERVIDVNRIVFYEKAEVTSEFLELAYISPSFYDEQEGPKYVISIHKVK